MIPIATKKVFCIFLLFLATNGFSQKGNVETAQLNRLAVSIDSIESTGENIRTYIVRKNLHTGYRLDIHYVIDTTSMTLLKCGYYEYYQNSRGDTTLYKATFYYHNGAFKLADLQTSVEGRHSPTERLYFVNEYGKIVKLISASDTERWDLPSIQDRVEEFLLDFSGIVAMIEKKKSGG